MYRSTKGASKARRDQINAEIRNLKDLLPISDVDKARLSYLHIMSLACMYTRKSVFFSDGKQHCAIPTLSHNTHAGIPLAQDRVALPEALHLLIYVTHKECESFVLFGHFYGYITIVH